MERCQQRKLLTSRSIPITRIVVHPGWCVVVVVVVRGRRRFESVVHLVGTKSRIRIVFLCRRTIITAPVRMTPERIMLRDVRSAPKRRFTLTDSVAAHHGRRW